MTELHRIVGAPWRRGLGRTHRSPRKRGRGQSLVEFALVLPVFLLIILTAIDFGRAFYSWVTVTSAARVAANYAALDPYASFAAGSDYDNLVRSDALSSICPIPPGGPPQPTFEDTALDSNTTSKDLGDTATVRISCSFGIITPVIGSVLGNSVSIAASATFTVRTGAYQP